jgi:hypothetical protein
VKYCVKGKQINKGDSPNGQGNLAPLGQRGVAVAWPAGSTQLSAPRA